jgi:O-antigen/teichoic acid export membrane protein
MSNVTSGSDEGVEVVSTDLSWPLWRWCKERLESRPFLRNVSIMVTGTASGQFVSLLLAPALTRLYSPQQFGVLSVYTAALTILTVVAAMRYEMTLPLAANDEDAINLTAVCGCALALTTAAVAFASALLPDAMVQRFMPGSDADTIAITRWLLPVGYLCLGAYFISLYLATREGAFRMIAMSRFNQGLVGPASQIVLAVTGAGTAGLLIGSILGQSVGTIGLTQKVIASKPGLLRAVNWRRMLELANRYRNFPLISSWTAFLGLGGGNQLLYLLVTMQYSAKIAGFIFLVERVVARPLTVIGTSILQVFVQEAGQMANAAPDKLRERFRQLVTHQFLLAAVWIVVANIAAAMLFPVVFGEEWSEATVYLQAISLAYLAQAVMQPVYHTLQILERQVMAATWQIARVALSVGVFVAGSYLELSAARVVFCYSLAQIACCAVLLLLISKSIQKLQRETLCDTSS